MTLISKFVILSLIATLIYFIGILIFITDHDENKCEMTYMFEYPQFVKINVPNYTQNTRYDLYAYSEGKLTEKARAMKYDGIPVLFVPGNAGSYKQARSLASVALRKALNSRVGYHFDFFTLDLNDELSGLNGALLNEQTSFLNHSIFRILDLYDGRKPNAPKSVILIGHSMGGVIAHSITANLKQVELLITLASPHKRPTVFLDKYMADYYRETSNKYLGSNGLTGKTIINIGGGFYDHLVNTASTNTTFSSLNVVSTGVPKVWISIEHPCIVWCKQLVLSVLRAMFDSVDLQTKQISLDHNYRLNAFKHHLVKNSGTNYRWIDRYKILTKLDDRGEWREDLRRLYSIDLPKGSLNNAWHMIRIIDDPKHKVLFVQAVNLALTDWIFACTADNIRGNGRYCNEGIHLSHASKIAPSGKLKRRTHYLHLARLKQRYPRISHVAVRVPPTSEAVALHFDVHNPLDRIVNIQVPHWIWMSRKSVIAQTLPEAMYYEIYLNGLQHVAQAFLLYIEPIECSQETHHATATLVVPWLRHEIHHFITESSKKPFLIRLHGSKPMNQNNMTAKLVLNLDPACQYAISLRPSFVGMLAQFVRNYSPLLISNVAAVVLMSYRSQLICLEENGYCTLFQSSLSMSTKPYYLITSAKLLSKLLTLIRLPFIPVPDNQILIDENLDFFILPLLLYVVSVGLTYLLSIILWAGIIMNESTVHKIVGKIFHRTLGNTFKMSEWVVNAMHRVPCVVAATLVALALTTCGSLALCLGLAYYFLKLTQLCQDSLEGLAYGYAKKFAYKIAGIFIRKYRNKQNEIVKHVEQEEKYKIPEVKKQCNMEVDNEINNVRLRKIQNDDNNETNAEIVEAKNEEVEQQLEEKDDKKNENIYGDSIDHSEMHFHYTIFLMWTIVAALNVPSVLTWARNFRYSSILNPDPSWVSGLVLCLCAIPLWQLEFPKTNKRFYKEIGLFVYGMALLVLIYAPFNLYRLSYILTATLVVTVIHQLLAPSRPEDEDEDEDDDEDDDTNTNSPFDLSKIIYKGDDGDDVQYKKFLNADHF